jgi:hypothetical protein
MTDFTIMAGIARDGSLELVFECCSCLETLVACHSEPGAAQRVVPGKSFRIGGVTVSKAADAAAYLAHTCDPARVLSSPVGT